ncbi:MAG: phospho-2-dehydro-3-deoxyheptonate aldolase [Myxococcaceae bacterium]|nr:phospho-2-dehydro-3-deoxyheptonate aldolase [Myxococcaceae bacterium]
MFDRSSFAPKGAPYPHATSELALARSEPVLPMSAGLKAMRMRRILRSTTGRTLLVPLDHGLTIGPVPGITRGRDAVLSAVSSSADGVILNKGLLRQSMGAFAGHPRVAAIVHLSGSLSLSPSANLKVATGTVADALALGADGVSVHLNIGCRDDHLMLEQAAEVASECDRWGVPLLMMMYPRGESVDELCPKNLAMAARAAMELGADLVKVNYTGTASSFREVIEGVEIPVVIAGGPAGGDVETLLSYVHAAMEAGAAGVAIGRNIFQYSQPTRLLRALELIIHEGRSLDDATVGLGTR